jgi:glucan biosynthesis protein C
VWHVKNDTVSLTLPLLGNLLTPWRLPLLFMISGLGTSYALGLSTAGHYVADRAPLAS